MWVKDYLSTEFCVIDPDKTIKNAVKAMVEKKTNSLVVVNAENKPIGTISAYTLIKEVVPEYLKNDPMYSNFGAEGTFDKYAAKIKDKKVEDIMNKDFHILKEDDAMIEAASYAVEASRRMLPVVDTEGKVVGVINRTSIKKALYDAIKNGDKDVS